MNNRTEENRNQSGVFGKTRIVSIVSGKGGVGKSVLTYGLAERLSYKSQRVLIVDADFYCGNQHVLANVTVGYGLREFMSDTLNLAQAVSTVASGIDLLPSIPGHTFDSGLDSGIGDTLINRLRDQAGQYDFILIDQASGVSESQLRMTCDSDEVLLIALPELTSISDVYGLYKRLHQAKAEAQCSLVVNRVSSNTEGEYIRDKFGALAERFIGSVPAFAGSVPEDEVVRQSVARQKTIIEISGQSAALNALGSLAGSMISHSTGSLSLPDPEININRQTADIRG